MTVSYDDNSMTHMTTFTEKLECETSSAFGVTEVVRMEISDYRYM